MRPTAPPLTARHALLLITLLITSLGASAASTLSAWYIGGSLSSNPSSIYIHNLGATSTDVTLTLYGEDGTRLCNGTTLVTGLAVNASASVTAATLEALCGTWSGRAWLSVSATAGVDLDLQHTLRTSSGGSVNLSASSSGSEVTAWYLPATASASLWGRLRLYNPGDVATDILATVYDADGTALCSGVTLVSGLAAKGQVALAQSDVESACGTSWSSYARAVLRSERSPGVSGPAITLSPLIVSKTTVVPTDVATVRTGNPISAYRVPNSLSTALAFLRLYNTSSRATQIVATVYDSSGTALCTEVSITSALVANAVLQVTPAMLESACGSSWTGYARVDFSSQLPSGGGEGPELSLLALLRTSDGSSANTTQIDMGSEVMTFQILGSIYSPRTTLYVFNTSAEAVNLLATLYDKTGTQLCNRVTLATGVAANALASFTASNLEALCGTWSSTARVIISSERAPGVSGPAITLMSLLINADSSITTSGETAARVDSDGEGVDDLLDNCQSTSNADQLDSDADGAGDACDTDDDDDGLSDSDETNLYATDPLDSDTDDDGLSDGDEVNLYGSDPLLSDSDGDGLSDAQEVGLGTDPNAAFNVIQGSSAGSNVSGSSGDDLIYLDRRNQSVNGGAGNDLFIAAIGNSYLTGGAGNDRYYYSAMNQGLDFIMDFDTSSDTIDLRAVLADDIVYSGTNPIADGYITFTDYGAYGCYLGLDRDGSGSAHSPVQLLFTLNVGCSALQSSGSLTW